MPLQKTKQSAPVTTEKRNELFDELEQQRVLDSVAKLTRDQGFRQIFPLPFEQKKIFTKNKDLRERFAETLHEITAPDSEEIVVAPTQAYNLLKFYLKNQEEIESTAQKWFYLSAVPRKSDKKKLTIGFELGIFVLGENSSLATAQLINAVHQIFSKLGVPDLVAEVNSLGCTSCQREFQEILESHFGMGASGFCDQCTNNIQSDALKVMTCQEGNCRQQLLGGPQMIDFLDEECRKDLVGTLEIMDEMETPYSLNPHLASEFLRDQILFRIGAQGKEEFEVLGEGGDHSMFAEHLGLDRIPVLGITVAIEELIPHIAPENVKAVDSVDVFVISLGDMAARRAMKLYQDLRRSGINTAEAMVGNSGIKRQLKKASSICSGVALIVGQKEALDDTVIMRDMNSGMQEVFTQERILEEVRKRIEN